MSAKNDRINNFTALAQMDASAQEDVDATKEDKSFLQKATEFVAGPVGPAIIKGLVKGGYQFMRGFGPLPAREESTEEFVGRDIPEQELHKNLAEILDVALPTQDEGLPGAISGFAERTSEIIPSLLTLPGMTPAQALGRSLLAGTFGETVKQVGGGETAQAIAETAAFFTPSPAKLASLTKNQSKLMEVGKRFGLTAEELAPALAEDSKITDVLARYAFKGEKIQDRLANTRKAVGRMYDGLKTGKAGNSPLSKDNSKVLLSTINEVLAELPDRFARAIDPDLAKLRASEMTGKDLITFWQAVTDQVARGNKRLGLLKDPLTVAMTSISPELASDFVLTNQLFAKQAKLSRKLKPDALDKILGRLEKLGIVVGASFGYYVPATEIALEATGRRVASEMLTNPRFLNLGRRLATAILNNSPAVAQRIIKEMDPILREIDPQLADEIANEDVMKIFQSKKEKN